MSFDRVLPRPTALFDEPASRLLHGHSNGFLDHKLANLSAHTRAASMSLVAVSEMPTTRSTTNSDNCSTALAQMQLSALNREQAGQNRLLAASFSAASTRQNTPVLATAESTAVVRDRAGSDSPTRLESVREAALQFCLCQPDPKIPRPRNAFILYRQHYQAAVVAQNPGLANPEISKIIGEQWRELPTESKEQWKALAEAEKARHQQQYPEYRYQPRRAGRDNSNRNGSNAGNPSGSITCNRCGGRLMNPPSTPHTPLTATMPSQQNNRAKDSVSPHPGSSLSSASSTSSSATSSAGGNDPSNINSKLPYKATETERQKNKNQWKKFDSVSSESKRRRLNNDAGTFQRGNNPVTEPYSLASQKTYVSRPGVAYFRSHVDQLATDEDFHQPQRSPALHEGEAYFDPSLTLPPLKAEDSPSAQPTTAQAQAETIMTIPVINKIRILSRVAPPLRDNSLQRGSLIAIEGRDPIQVKLMMKYLGQLLSESGRYLVRVFEGPEVARRGSICDEKKDATVDYLNVISDWHRVSDEIIQFISSKDSKALSSTRTCSIASAHSPGSDATASPSPTLSQAGTAQLPIALVPRYQLTTADTFACSIPINDSYACLEHWQWIASLWRACVGPDVTVHIRECEREEIDRYGPGNPVEVRLNEARTLIIRRAMDSPKDIEEKAFKRVGFEIEDFLTR